MGAHVRHRTCRIAEGEGGRGGKGGSVEPSVEARLSRAVYTNGQRGAIRPLASAEGVGRIRTYADGKRITGLKRGNAVDAPARDQFAGQTGSVLPNLCFWPNGRS